MKNFGCLLSHCPLFPTRIHWACCWLTSISRHVTNRWDWLSSADRELHLMLLLAGWRSGQGEVSHPPTRWEKRTYQRTSESQVVAPDEKREVRQVPDRRREKFPITGREEKKPNEESIVSEPHLTFPFTNHSQSQTSGHSTNAPVKSLAIIEREVLVLPDWALVDPKSCSSSLTFLRQPEWKVKKLRQP